MWQVGDRLKYWLLDGQGPTEGWISVRISGKELAECIERFPWMEDSEISSF